MSAALSLQTSQQHHGPTHRTGSSHGPRQRFVQQRARPPRSRASHDSPRSAHMYDSRMHRPHGRSHSQALSFICTRAERSTRASAPWEISAAGHLLRSQHARAVRIVAIGERVRRFGLLQPAEDEQQSESTDSLDYGRRFCDAYETHQQLLNTQTLSFEHAWFLLQLLNRSGDLRAMRCRHCDSYYLKDKFNLCRHTCPTCRLKRARGRGTPRPSPVRVHAL